MVNPNITIRFKIAFLAAGVIIGALLSTTFFYILQPNTSSNLHIDIYKSFNTNNESYRSPEPLYQTDFAYDTFFFFNGWAFKVN